MSAAHTWFARVIRGRILRIRSLSRLGIDSPFRRWLADARLPQWPAAPSVSSAAAPAFDLPPYPAGPARPSSAWNRSRGFPATGGPVPSAGTGPPVSYPWGGSRGWSGSLPATGTAALSTGSHVAGLPVHAAGLGSGTGPFLQEIPLHLELADLLVQPSHQGVLALRTDSLDLLLALTGPEDRSRASDQGLLPSLNLVGVNLVPGSQLGHRKNGLFRSARPSSPPVQLWL